MSKKFAMINVTIMLVANTRNHQYRRGRMSKIYQVISSPKLILPLLVLFALLFSACGNLSTEPEIVATIPPEPTNIPLESIETVNLEDVDLQDGARIFAENCTACHGITGQGDGELVQSGQIETIPNFLDPSAIEGQTINDYFEIITNGRLDTLMPPWVNSLSDDERWAVAWFVYTLNDIDLTFSPPEFTAEPEPEIIETIGVVTGVINNGTEDGFVPDGISIALHVLDSQFSELDFQTTLSESGQYTFENITLNNTHNYLVTAVYNETVFTTEVVLGNAFDGAMQLPLTIYDATNDPEVIEIDLLLTQIRKMDDGGVYISQVISFNNTSDRLYTTDIEVDDFRNQTVAISLPEGAELVPTDELIQRFLLGTDDNTLYDTEPVLPNTEHLVYLNYRLPYIEGMTFEFPVNYDMSNQIEVMVEPSAFGIGGTQIRNHGTQNFANGVFNSYLGDPVSAGEQISFELLSAESLAVSTSDSTSGTTFSPLAIAAGGIGVLLMVASGAYFFLDYQRQSQMTDDDIIKQMATLDQNFKAGKINQRDYDNQRNRLKAQLTQRMKSRPADDTVGG